MNSDTSEKVRLFFDAERTTTYKKGELLLEPGVEPTGVFYIKKGTVKMTAISPNGEEVVINTFKTGAFFPIGWLLNGTPNNYYFQAADDTEVNKATKSDVLNFLEEQPEVVFDLMKRIYKGLDGYFMRMEYLMAGNAYTRLIIELIIMAKRFGEKNQSNDSVRFKTTEKDLAAQTGITRETVSREFKKLIQKNIISFAKEEVIVHNILNLEKELGN
jgi:CRP/FNR family transcriptional regulator